MESINWLESIGIIIAIVGLVVILLYSGNGLYWALSKKDDDGITISLTLIALFVIWCLAVFSIITLGHILVNMGGL